MRVQAPVGFARSSSEGAVRAIVQLRPVLFYIYGKDNNPYTALICSLSRFPCDYAGARLPLADATMPGRRPPTRHLSESLRLAVTRLLC